MSARDPKKFDPANAAQLDAPERERFLPTETVIDYGAGSRVVARAVAEALAFRAYPA